MPRAQEAVIESDGEIPRPVVTWVLLGIIGAIFVAMAVVGRHVMAMPDAVYDLFGDKNNALMIESGHLTQWWRFVTPIFLHAGLIHLAVNSYSLFVLGRQLEPFYGSKRYFILFMAAGIAGVAASYRFSHNPSLGASGALFGLVGAGIVFPIRFRRLIPPEQGKRIVVQLVTVAALNLAVGFSLSHMVDNSAHVGGLIGGGVAALFLLPDALDERKIHSETGQWAVCAFLAGLVVVSFGMQARWALGPWWRIQVPADLKPARPITQFSGDWKAPDGSEIELADVAHSQNLFPLAALYWERQDLPQNPVAFNGWRGRSFESSDSSNVIRLYVINIYGRLFMVRMHTSVAAYGTRSKQFDAAIGSLRFLHDPPPDLHPIALIINGKPVTPAGARLNQHP